MLSDRNIIKRITAVPRSGCLSKIINGINVNARKIFIIEVNPIVPLSSMKCRAMTIMNISLNISDG